MGLAKGAVEAIKEQWTVHGLAVKYGIHPTRMTGDERDRPEVPGLSVPRRGTDDGIPENEPGICCGGKAYQAIVQGHEPEGHPPQKESRQGK